MCTSPIRIRNPNAGMKGMKSTLMKDTTSAFINVSCGHCPECIANKQMSFVQRIQCEALVNHLFFITLTYNNDMIPVVSTSTGHDIRFADIQDVQNMFKRIRLAKSAPRDFRFFGVSELGSKKGRPHFHILLFVPKYDKDTFVDCLQMEKQFFDLILSEWKRNVASPIWSSKKQKYIPNRRNPVWKPLCTYKKMFIRGKIRTNYDCHFVNPVLSSGQEADVAFYVLKYMLKPSSREVRLQRALHLNLDSEEYDAVWSLVRSRHFESDCFGLGQSVYDDLNKPVIAPKVLDWLRNCVSRSKSAKSTFPLFYSPVTGKSFPLSRYYFRFSEVIDLQDALDFYYNDKDGRVDNVIIPDDVTIDQLLQQEKNFDKKVKLVSDQDSALELDELF